MKSSLRERSRQPERRASEASPGARKRWGWGPSAVIRVLENSTRTLREGSEPSEERGEQVSTYESGSGEDHLVDVTRAPALFQRSHGVLGRRIGR